MKKIVLTFALAAFAFAANAQFVISANIGGNMTSGNTITTTHITVVTDSTFTSDVPMQSTTNFTGGIKAGYKFGKFQAGIAGSFSMYTYENQELDPTIIPIPGNIISTIATTGSMSTKGNVITVSPYLRYDFLTAGDVSLFAELSFNYSMSNNPEVHATMKNVGPMNFSLSLDSTFTRPLSSTTMGVNLVPGLSWQLSKNCGIDLYLDFLAIAYSSTNAIRTVIDYEYHFNGVDLTYFATPHDIITTESSFGAALTGTPLLTQLGANNWVRVGFNFTF